MSFDSFRSALTKYVDTNYDDSTYGTMFYENRKITPPSGPYAYMSIIGGPSGQPSLGGDTNIIRNFGSVQMEYLVPEDTGITIATEFSDHIVSFLLNASFRLSDGDFAQLRVPQFRALGMLSGRYRFVSSTEFYRDAYLSNPVQVVQQY